VLGIAREVAAITAADLYLLEINSIPGELDEVLNVNVVAADASPLYCGRIMRGVNLDVPTPLWILQRLERVGIRSINPIVDITNYVLLELVNQCMLSIWLKLMGVYRCVMPFPKKK
jgi:phenylalanyl-tRNA synthetase beta chain